MLKKFIIAAGVIVLAAILFIAYMVLFTGPDLSKYEFLKEPRITTLPNQKMLVVTAAGDPNVVGGRAFSLLFKTYVKIPGIPKSMHLAPRARWIGDMNTKSSWTGYYALPVPEETTTLPEIAPEPGYKVEILTWEYGTVAEILHIGPYAEEAPTIERLHQYITQQGYEIIGDHEEEYVKGPGMFSKGDPAKYYTIIRLRVKKKA